MPTLESALQNDTTVDSNDLRFDRATDGNKTLRTRIAEVAATADSAVQPGDNISSLTNDSGYITGYSVTQGDVTQHEAALTITESQISDLGDYVPEPPAGGTYYARANSPDGWLALGTAATEDADAFLQPGDNVSALTNDASYLTGPIDVGDIDASGTASSSTYLRGDGAWATPSGAATSTATETDASPGASGYKELSGGTFVDRTTATLVTDTNYALAPSEHVVTNASLGSITGTVTAAGVTLTSYLSSTAESFYWQTSFQLLDTVTPLSGETYYGVYLIRDDAGTDVDFSIKASRGSDDDYLDISLPSYAFRGDSSGSNQIFSDSGEPGTTIAAPWNKAYTRVVEIGTSPRLFLAYVEFEFLEDYGEAFTSQVLRIQTDEAYSATCLYFGETAVDLDTDAIQIPEFVASTSITLTGSGPWRATVNGSEATLVPPPLPTNADERVDAVVYVTLSGGGSLVLDASAAWAYDAPDSDTLSGDGSYELLLTGREADTVWRVVWAGPQL